MTQSEPTDPQSIAFREATEQDSWDGAIAALIAEGAVHHPPITNLDDIALPEHFEERNWDQGRVGPKSLDEAREALAERIRSRSAPDSLDAENAYDDGHDDSNDPPPEYRRYDESDD